MECCGGCWGARRRGEARGEGDGSEVGGEDEMREKRDGSEGERLRKK